jgi:hypothetical protein
MAQVASIEFIDKDSGQPAFAAVRVEGGVVGVALSLQDDGDLEVFLDADEVQRFVDALTRAHSLMGSEPSGGS